MKPDIYRSMISRKPRWRSLLWLLLLVVPAGQASGWNDFVLDIGEGYHISKMSSLEVCIGKEHGPLILCGSKGSNIGPVDAYIVTPDHIISRNLGRKPKTYDDGYVIDTVDTEVQHYFVIDKRTEMLRGPFTQIEFQQRAEVAALGTLIWESPTNPDTGLLIGLVAFVLSVVLFVLAVPVIVVLLLVSWLKRLRAPQSMQASISNS